jgi:hypothetical protein
MKTIYIKKRERKISVQKAVKTKTDLRTGASGEKKTAPHN